MERVPTLLHLFCMVKDLGYPRDRHVPQLRLELVGCRLSRRHIDADPQPATHAHQSAPLSHNCSKTLLSTCLSLASLFHQTALREIGVR